MKVRINYLLLALLICLSIISIGTIAQTSSDTSYFNESNEVADYRVAFDDSGLGGLIFALDVLQELETQLVELESKYKVHFIFQHVGDSKNAPYGNRTPAKIAELTKAIVGYTADLPYTKTLVIACNTASTVCNEEMNVYFKEKYHWLNVISMIEKSSKEIIDLASDVSSNNKELYIALFATPATIRSHAYQIQIKNISTKDGQKLKLYTYSPVTWVNNIEKGVDKKTAKIDIQNDLEIFKNNLGDDFQKISTIGLFCTHYPYYRNEIERFFQDHGNKNVNILTQGHIFADDIYFDILKNIKSDSLSYPKRSNVLKEHDVFKIQILSNITGENSSEMKSVICKTHPQFSKRIIFSTVHFIK